MDPSTPTAEFRQARAAPEGASLSTRQRAVMLLMGRGLSRKAIARELGIAPETVKTHAKQIFSKLTARSRAEAVARAAALGLMNPGFFPRPRNPKAPIPGDHP